jgi:hypothetical protein
VAVDGIRTARDIIVTVNANRRLRRHHRQPDAGQKDAGTVEDSERAQRPRSGARDRPQNSHQRGGQEMPDVGLHHEKRQDRDAAGDEHAVHDDEETEREQEDRLTEQRQPVLHELRTGPRVEPRTD